MKVFALYAIVLGLVLPLPAMAKQVTITPIASLRVVNPGNADDVRHLYKFTLPEDVHDGEVVYAFLRVATKAENEMLVSVGAVQGSWRTSDTWSSLTTALDSDAGFLATGTGCIVASNHLEGSGELKFDAGIEIAVTELVTAWAGGGANGGLCIRGLASRSDDVAELLAADLPAPELVILYTSR